MTQILPISQNLYCGYIVPGAIPEYEEEEDIDLEEGFVELEDEQEEEEGIEWLYEEELETQIDGPRGPVIIKKGRYTELL